jgi:hypothetical protein
MKGAEPQIILPPFTEGDIGAYDIHYIGCGSNFFNYFAVDLAHQSPSMAIRVSGEQ